MPPAGFETTTATSDPNHRPRGHWHRLALLLQMLNNSYSELLGYDAVYSGNWLETCRRKIWPKFPPESLLSIYAAGVHKFSPNLEVNAKFYVRQNGDMKQVPYWEPTGIRYHRAKFSGHGDLALWICTPLLHGVWIQKGRNKTSPLWQPAKLILLSYVWLKEDDIFNNTAIFWNVTPYSLVEMHRRFGGSAFHRNVSESLTDHDDRFQKKVISSVYPLRPQNFKYFLRVKRFVDRLWAETWRKTEPSSLWERKTLPIFCV
jgi:hypothetical protein